MGKANPPCQNTDVKESTEKSKEHEDSGRLLLPEKYLR